MVVNLRDMERWRGVLWEEVGSHFIALGKIYSIWQAEK